MVINTRIAARPRKQRVSGSSSIPAPIGGWNARDPLANMAPTDAITLTNWFPRTGDILMRYGFSNHVTGFPSVVNSLMAYAGPSSTTLFAASSTGIYNATTAGAVGAAVVTGLTSTKFNYINIRTAGGQYLWAVNGSDLAQLYDGTTWSNPSVTGLGAFTTADFSHIALWKNRIFLVQKNSMSVWYLGTNSISGAASEINFGPLFKKGGKVVAVANWTIDGGYGMDDQFVIITSKGEIAVYRGTNPASASDFLLVGVYELGAPVSDKCFVKYAGDLALVTFDGLIPLSRALISTRTDNRIAISDKIQSAFNSATQLYQNNYGWQPILFPKENMLIVNVPITAGVEANQYVMNVLTGAWCKFTGWNANCFELMDDDLYFGGDTVVCKAWDTNADNSATITASAKQAFNYFNTIGQNKQFKMARPVFTSSDVPSPTMSINVDFQDAANETATTFANPYAIWDSSLWDIGLWGGDAVFKDWQTIQGVGYCAALRLIVASTSLQLAWAATDFVYEVGGII